MTDMGPGSLQFQVQGWARGTGALDSRSSSFLPRERQEAHWPLLCSRPVTLIGFPAAVISESLQLICPQGGAWELLAAQQVACFPA